MRWYWCSLFGELGYVGYVLICINGSLLKKHLRMLGQVVAMLSCTIRTLLFQAWNRRACWILFYWADSGHNVCFFSMGNRIYGVCVFQFQSVDVCQGSQAYKIVHIRCVFSMLTYSFPFVCGLVFVCIFFVCLGFFLPWRLRKKRFLYAVIENFYENVWRFRKNILPLQPLTTSKGA